MRLRGRKHMNTKDRSLNSKPQCLKRYYFGIYIKIQLERILGHSEKSDFLIQEWLERYTRKKRET